MSYFPSNGDWPEIEPALAGFDEQRLEAFVRFAEAAGSAQLVVLVGGQRLVDKVFDEDPVDVAAIQKGLVSLMLGKAIADGWISLDDPVNRHLPAGWTRLPADDEASLTIRHLVTMTTGMSDELEPQGTIGETWRYNNTAYNYLKRILFEHEGLTLEALTSRWMLDPLGMAQTKWIARDLTLPDGRPFTGLATTARNVARLGLLVANRGRWHDEQIVPADYVDHIAEPGSAENPAWGLMWWNNRSDRFLLPMREDKRHEGPAIPTAPADLIAARGAMENHLGIIPSLDLIVARTTRRPARGERPARFENPCYEHLLAARI